MKRVISIATAMVMAVLVMLTISVTAQDFNPLEKTFLTFSAPVELPGVTLPAGTYMFKLADTPGRNVVQVMSADGKDILGQWLFVQAERPDVSGETVVTFRETTAGATPAVQYWYYPGEKIGKEFIYPKEQGAKIAARTGAEVRTSDEPVNVEVAAAEPAPVEQPATVAAAPEPAPAPEPSAAPEPAAAPKPAPVAVQAEARTQEPQAVGTSGELPRTASPLPLSGLLGLFSLAGAAGIRKFRR
jgi:hypothetical protein